MKQMAQALSLPAEESRAIASVYTLEERVSSSDDILWGFFFLFFLCGPSESRSSPFPTIIFVVQT